MRMAGRYSPSGGRSYLQNDIAEVGNGPFARASRTGDRGSTADVVALARLPREPEEVCLMKRIGLASVAVAAMLAAGCHKSDQTKPAGDTVGTAGRAGSSVAAATGISSRTSRAPTPPRLTCRSSRSSAAAAPM